MLCVGMAENLEVVEGMQKLAEKMSFETKDVSKLVKKVFSVCFRYVSAVDLWKNLFGEDFVDWEKRGVYKLEAMQFWLALFRLCSWEDLTKIEKGIKESQPVLFATRQNLREAG